jgi:sulfur-carrier protein adenylyltransferase/sulfurtransferase
MSELTREEVKRYSRHLILPEVGLDGQEALKDASILLIGTGGLGAPLATYLSAAGIGKLGLVDNDVVDTSNLQRQIIHTTHDVGRSKLESAKESINALNPEVNVELYETFLRSDNAMEIAKDYDIIIDGTDNFPTRYLVNDLCVLLKKPNVYGSVFRFDGQATVFDAQKGPCYRCLFPEPPPPGMVPSCAEGGVLGVLPGLIGMIQATEAIKLIIGHGETLIGRLIVFDALGMRFREMKLKKDPNCPICGENPTVTELIDYEQFCGISDAEHEPYDGELEISAKELEERLKGDNPPFLLDVREWEEHELCHIENSTLIPIENLSAQYQALDPTRETVAICKVGIRSMRAQQFLMEHGFTKVWNLTGGIVEWREDVDPEMYEY